MEEASRGSVSFVGNTSEVQKRREVALQVLGKAVASLPFNKQAVEKAMEKIVEIGGEALVAETVLTIAVFEAVTRIADATMLVNLPGPMLTVMKAINAIGFACSLRNAMIALSVMGAVGVAVVVTKK